MGALDMNIHTQVCAATPQLRRPRSTCKNGSRVTFTLLPPASCVYCVQGRPLSFCVLHKMEVAWADGEIQSRTEDKTHHGRGLGEQAAGESLKHSCQYDCQP